MIGAWPSFLVWSLTCYCNKYLLCYKQTNQYFCSILPGWSKRQYFIHYSTMYWSLFFFNTHILCTSILTYSVSFVIFEVHHSGRIHFFCVWSYHIEWQCSNVCQKYTYVFIIRLPEEALLSDSQLIMTKTLSNWCLGPQKNRITIQKNILSCFECKIACLVCMCGKECFRHTSPRHTLAPQNTH